MFSEIPRLLMQTFGAMFDLLFVLKVILSVLLKQFASAADNKLL